MRQRNGGVSASCNLRRRNFVLGEIDNLRRDFAAAAVEHDEFIAALHAQDIARVMRFRSAQNERVRIPIFRRDVETMHRGNLQITQISADLR